MSSENVSTLYLCLNVTSFIYLFIDFSQTNLILINSISTIEKEFIYYKRIFVLLVYILFLYVLHIFFHLNQLLLIYSLLIFSDNCIKTFYLLILNAKKNNFYLLLTFKLVSFYLLFLYFFDWGIKSPVILFSIYTVLIITLMVYNINREKLKDIIKIGICSLYSQNLINILSKNLILLINQLSYILKFILLSYILKEFFIDNAKDFRIIAMELSVIQILVFSFGYKYFQETKNFQTFIIKIIKFILPLTIFSSILLGGYKFLVLNIPVYFTDILFYFLSLSELFYLVLITYFSLSLKKSSVVMLTIANFFLGIVVFSFSFIRKLEFNYFLITYFSIQFIGFLYIMIKTYLNDNESYLETQLD